MGEGKRGSLAYLKAYLEAENTGTARTTLRKRWHRHWNLAHHHLVRVVAAHLTLHRVAAEAIDEVVEMGLGDVVWRRGKCYCTWNDSPLRWRAGQRLGELYSSKDTRCGGHHTVSARE